MSALVRNATATVLDRVACWRPAAGAVSAWLRWRGEQSFAVLTYHRIGGAADDFFPGIDASSFARQMRLLSQHCRVLPLSELLDRASAGSLPAAAVGISFDDNYASVHEIAWPIMRRLGLPGTIFVPTAPLMHDEPLWYDRVSHAFKYAGSERLDADEFGGSGCMLDTPARRVIACDTTLARLRGLPESDRDAAIRSLERALRPAAWRHEPALRHGSLEQLRGHRLEGLAVGAHSVTHPIFARLDRLRARAELRECKGQLEGWLQHPVDLFAYPNGREADFDADTVRELAGADYRAAFTTIAGVNGPDWEADPYRLRRIDAAGTEARRLILRLTALRLAA